jgi:acetyl esterase/lipase
MSPKIFVDPEVEKALSALPMGPLNLTHESLPKIRAERAAGARLIKLGDQVDRTDMTVPGVPGDPDIRLRVYRPKGAEGNLGCLFWIHGGGYVLGLLEQNDPMFDYLCVTLNCVAVSVGYRISPETPYPGALNDCYAGLKYTFAHADELGIDPSRIGFGGASAGGGLAAGLAHFVRDKGELAPVFQYLVYPMIDDTQTTESSSWDVPIWSPAANTFGWKAYLGDLYGGDVPPTAAAKRATNFEGLPPAFIMVGSVDGFLDEDVEYATRMNRAGVPTELHVYPGAPHGFDSFAPGTLVAKRARQAATEWLNRHLNP